MTNFIYNIYGSEDSTDVDIVVYLDELPNIIEDRKILTKEIQNVLNIYNSNIIIAKLNNGNIIDCTYPKSSYDSLNNAVYNTYHLHKQIHKCQVKTILKRNKILAIYKTIRILSTYLTRTKYRTLIRPDLHYSIDLNKKINNLLKVDFYQIDSFNQKNQKDEDIWKVFIFYIVQNIELLKENELYTKKDILNIEQKSYNFLYRKQLTIEDKLWFDKYVKDYLLIIQKLPIIVNNEIISLYEEKANIKLEIPNIKLEIPNIKLEIPI